MKTTPIDLPMMGRGSANQTLTWLTVTVLSMSAFAFLPRQFHVGVVENDDERNVKTAMWLTPLFLLAINVFVVPIALGGAKIGIPGMSGDEYVLALPVAGHQHGLALAVFLGGFSAAIGMIMIEGMTTATMISNHLLMPLFQKVPALKFLQRRMLYVRWVAAAGFIGAGYAFEVGVGNSYMLVAIGLVSFAAALVVAPVLLGGLFWRSASRVGAIASLCTGFVLWAFTLLLPTFIKSDWLPRAILSEGLFGLFWLRPEALLGLDGLPALTHGVIWSGGGCILAYVGGSALSAPSKQERALTDEFLDEGSTYSGVTSDATTFDAQETYAKTTALFSRFFSPAESENHSKRCFNEAGYDDAPEIDIVRYADIHNRVEKTLAGAIGAATAHAVMKAWGTIDRVDQKSLMREYAKMMARMRLSPKEIKERINYQQEREDLLTEQFQALSKKVEERDAEIRERKRAEAELQEAHDSLEQRVQDRTAELARRGRDMRLVLDNVDQGFITIDLQGNMSSEMSAVVETWLGRPKDEDSFFDYMDRFAPEAGMLLELGLESFQDGFLPPDLCADQMPSRFTNSERTLDACYRPVYDTEGEVSHLLVILTDVTEKLAHQHVEELQREVLHVFDRIMHDRAGFLEFLDEARKLVSAILDPAALDHTTLARVIHTLKGNTGVFGMFSIAQLCHDMEEHMADTQEPPSVEQLNGLRSHWEELESNLAKFLGDMDRGLELSDTQYEEVLHAALNGVTGAPLVHIIKAWRLEPTEPRLQRLGEQAGQIAQRLSKGDLQIEIAANDVRLKPDTWAGFWSSLVHVIRNCVDHGIEPPAERIEAGKAEHGTFRLTTAMTSDRFVVEVADDGRGIDWNRIRAKAEQLGLPSASHDDLVSALFHDGLSTRDQASEYSGRGVGMSAVKAEVEQLGGSVEITSQPGQGTTFRFSFPQPRMTLPPLAA